MPMRLILHIGHFLKATESIKNSRPFGREFFIACIICHHRYLYHCVTDTNITYMIG